MKDLIKINITKCPYCDYSSNYGIGFTSLRNEIGSGGIRTFRCPNCGKEAGE